MIPRKYQEEAAAAAFSSKKNPVVVMPTGSGKSLVICLTVDLIMSANPYSRIAILSHVQEILEQDHDALSEYFRGVNIGLYSKGLDSEDVQRITVAGIQSVYRRPNILGDIDVVIVDEAHMIPMRESSMYRKFLAAPDNPPKVIGLTATHFRLGHGYIHEGEDAIFDEVCYDLSAPDKFKELQDNGYLSKLITKGTLLNMDRTGLKVTAGDFNLKGLSDRFDRTPVTDAAVDEIVTFGKNYKKWLVFAIDIDHAEHITRALISRSISAICIHSKMDHDRTQAINDIKNGKYRAIVNVDILTTGFDVPDIDLIAILRHTKSPVIHVQTIGRGLRVSPDKDHCLVLDFAGNTEYLGPIDNVLIEPAKKGKGGGEAIMKKCPECKVLAYPSVRVCDICGHEYLFKHGLNSSSGDLSLTTSFIEEWCNVDYVDYDIIDLRNKPSALRVSYHTGFNTYSELVFLADSGHSRFRANSWVKYRTPPGEKNFTSLQDVYQNSHLLNTPKMILVKVGGKFPRIKDMIF